MPSRLIRFHQTGNFHFITFSCHQRRPLLAERNGYALFEQALERVRQRFEMVVAGYVLMPEHVHLLINEPSEGPLASAIQVLKQTVSRTLKRPEEPRFWQPRYYDFNVHNDEKRIEKLHYMHLNPVTRGLVTQPEDWPWSSFRHCATGHVGTVEIESQWTAFQRDNQLPEAMRYNEEVS
jgi:putative transposase